MRKTEEIGWRFPSTDGGMEAGFNDPGMAHFRGARFASLARETIQNSLDAKLDNGSAVQVEFQLKEIEGRNIGREELLNAVNSCIDCAEQTDNEAQEFFREAQQILSGEKIQCLHVSDVNTSGLRGKHWQALVKMQGLSFKPDVKGAGGSHGIGKNAPFAVSGTRTVFYWTCFEEDGNPKEMFQGKSTLMSHLNEQGKTVQGTGFFGVKKDCKEISSDIPRDFRLLDRDENAKQGTALTILGFQEVDDWRLRVATSAVGNFFFAIQSGQLELIIEPDERNNLIEVKQSTLQDCFELLEEHGSAEGTSDIGTDISLRDARIFWELTKGQPTVEKQDPDLGHCKLWICTDEGFPSKVALVRRTGMVITTCQTGLIRFSGFKDFAAVCLFEDPEGNELLRQMENPQHDKFEPERINAKESREKAQRSLNRITRWIRAEIKKMAGPPEGGRCTVLSELAHLLPDYQYEEPFDEDGGRGGKGTEEKGFGASVTVTLKPIRRLIPSSAPTSDSGHPGEDSSAEESGVSGGAGTGASTSRGGDGGSGDGEGKGGSGSMGRSENTRKVINISSVRILPISTEENHFRVAFTPHQSGLARILFEEIGDSTTQIRSNVRSIDANISLNQIELRKRERVVLDVTSDLPIGDRAWRISAIETSQERDGGHEI